MRISLRRYVVGCLLVFIVSCQPKVLPVLTEAKPEMKSLTSLFSELEARKLAIRDVKAFLRTKISGENLNQSFRQTLLVKGDEAMRVDTYSLFRQVLGVLIYEGEKTLMYDPKIEGYEFKPGFSGMAQDTGSAQTMFKGVHWGKAMMWIFLLSDTFIDRKSVV